MTLSVVVSSYSVIPCMCTQSLHTLHTKKLQHSKPCEPRPTQRTLSRGCPAAISSSRQARSVPSTSLPAALCQFLRPIGRGCRRRAFWLLASFSWPPAPPFALACGPSRPEEKLIIINLRSLLYVFSAHHVEERTSVLRTSAYVQ